MGRGALTLSVAYFSHEMMKTKKRKKTKKKAPYNQRRKTAYSAKGEKLKEINKLEKLI